MANVPARGLPDSSAELVRLAAAGHEPAFARIIRLHHAELVRLAFVITGEADLAEAAVAATWPIAWGRLRQLEEPDRLTHWLAAIVAVEARQIVRGPWLTAAPADPATTPADERLAVALAGLTRDDRALLALQVVAGLEWSAIGRALGWPAKDGPARLCRVLGGEALGTLGAEAALAGRLVAYADIPVRPVDADRVARVARAEIRAERHHLISIVVAAVLAVIVVVTLDVVGAGSTGNPLWQSTGTQPGRSAGAPGASDAPGEPRP